jgi:hypothetical protein
MVCLLSWNPVLIWWFSNDYWKLSSSDRPSRASLLSHNISHILYSALSGRRCWILRFRNLIILYYISAQMIKFQLLDWRPFWGVKKKWVYNHDKYWHLRAVKVNHKCMVLWFHCDCINIPPSSRWGSLDIGNKISTLGLEPIFCEVKKKWDNVYHVRYNHAMTTIDIWGLSK